MATMKLCGKGEVTVMSLLFDATCEKGHVFSSAAFCKLEQRRKIKKGGWAGLAWGGFWTDRIDTCEIEHLSSFLTRSANTNSDISSMPRMQCGGGGGGGGRGLECKK